MELKIANNNDVVYIKITIKHLGAWRYLYIASAHDDPFKGKSDTAGPPPFIHTIGCGKDIIYGYNSWNLELFNQSGQDLHYEVFIEWFQKNDENKIGTWKKDGDMKKGAAPLHLDGYCTYES